MARVVTVNDVLDGHVVLDIECLDRIYLNAYVPILQSSGQVVAFMTQHLGKPIPSPALMEHIGTRFRKAVESYASANGIPWVKFGKDDRKVDVMLPHIAAQAATGRPGVAALGVAQEFQRVWSAYQRDTKTAAPQYTFAKADRRVTCYYFYLWDEDPGPAFVKVCACFPYPAKIWVNAHERAKRQALKAGTGFTALSNGFASCDDPAGLQEICDRLQPGTIEVFAQRWLHRIPVPFGPADRDAGYWRECSMRQVETSRAIVFDAPRRARFFFEALIGDNLGIGRPARLPNLSDLQDKARAINRRILETERAGQGTVLASPAFERIAHPSVTSDGRRTPALRFGDPRVMALAGALCATLLAATGITNKSLRALMTGLLHAPCTPGQTTYDLLRPLMAARRPQAPPELRDALRVIDHQVNDYVSRARLGKAA